MIRLISSKLILPGLAAVLLMPVSPSPLSAQSTSKTATIISDAQAQTLLQLLAAQQNGGTALTAAQSQMLMQYLLSKSGSSASTALGTAQTQVQTQMMLQSIASQSAAQGLAAQSLAAQGHGLSAAKALPGPTPTVTMPAATASPAAPAPALGDKKPAWCESASPCRKLRSDKAHKDRPQASPCESCSCSTSPDPPSRPYPSLPCCPIKWKLRRRRSNAIFSSTATLARRSRPEAWASSRMPPAWPI
jgi:hypothetical protein